MPFSEIAVLILLAYFPRPCCLDVPRIAQLTRRMEKTYHSAGAKNWMNTLMLSLVHNQMGSGVYELVREKVYITHLRCRSVRHPSLCIPFYTLLMLLQFLLFVLKAPTA